jgi:DNA-binding response OmpR family regulator
MKILLAEDDLRLGELVTYLLRRKGGHQVDWLTDGSDVYDYALQTSYDILILDWMLPTEEGVQICRRLRKANYSGAILMLTARDSLQDRIMGLDAGADDYIVKPFEAEELLARVRVLMRRNFTTVQSRIIPLRNLTIDLDNRSVRSSHQELQLSSREFQLLELFIRHMGQVLSREQMFDRIWGFDAEASLKIIDATVKLLRKKLLLADRHDYITSIRGVGYRFDE